jgi:hypothetical protein
MCLETMKQAKYKLQATTRHKLTQIHQSSNVVRDRASQFVFLEQEFICKKKQPSNLLDEKHTFLCCSRRQTEERTQTR